MTAVGGTLCLACETSHAEKGIPFCRPCLDALVAFRDRGMSTKTQKAIKHAIGRCYCCDAWDEQNGLCRGHFAIFKAGRMLRPIQLEPRCPWCGGETESGEYVDVGVGGEGMQVSPDFCLVCNAAQVGARVDSFSVGEIRDGWERGDEEREREYRAWLLTPLGDFDS